jgi:hypothetical protein
VNEKRATSFQVTTDFAALYIDNPATSQCGSVSDIAGNQKFCGFDRAYTKQSIRLKESLLSIKEPTFISVGILQIRNPRQPVFGELFNFGSKLFALDIKVIHGANSWNQFPWVPKYQSAMQVCLSRASTVPAANSIHECSTDAAEVVGHTISGGDGLALLVFGELVFSPDMHCCGFVDHKVGRKSGGVNFVIVGAVADERGYEIGSFDRLKSLSHRSLLLNTGHSHQ